MSRRKRVFRSSILIALVMMMGLTALFPGGANAQQPPADSDSTPVAGTPAADVAPRFVIFPKGGTDGDFFTLQAQPGSVHELVVVLGNADDDPLSLRTYASDVMPIVNGGFALAPEQLEVTGTTAWLDYPAETFEFAPGDGVERTFTVTVPADVAPGQYITGLALETAEPLEVEGSSLFKQVIRKTIAVFIIVPGPETAAYAIGTPAVLTEGGLTRIVMDVTNTGNVLVRPSGELTIRDTTGTTVVTASIAMGSVYAGFTVPLSVALTTPLNEGEYTVAVELTDPASGISVAIADAPITILSPQELATRVRIDATVSLMPGSSNPAFAEVALTITNPGQPVANAEIVLEASLDGELVERFKLIQTIALPTGDTVVSQRYVPVTGWQDGSWSFVIQVNAVDSASNTTTTLATLDTLDPVNVGD